jgi:membrane protein required for colicin V production
VSIFAGMTWLDWVFLVVLVSSVVGSIVKGFVREAISLASVVIGIIVACWYFAPVGRFFVSFVKTQDIADLIGFILVFVGCVLAGSLISFVVSKFVQAASLQWFDRLLGAAFGLLRGWLIGSVLFLCLTAFPVKLESVRDAKFAPYLLMGARVLSVMVPAELKNRFLQGYHKIEEFWRSRG